jgi:hypothetical protein
MQDILKRDVQGSKQDEMYFLQRNTGVGSRNKAIFV